MTAGVKDGLFHKSSWENCLAIEGRWTVIQLFDSLHPSKFQLKWRHKQWKKILEENVGKHFLILW